MANSVLRVDASARYEGSVTRDFTQRIIDKLAPERVVTRDLAQPLPLLDETWVHANFTPADNRSEDQVAKLALSDELIAEIKAADVLVIGAPVYNFSVPAVLKAWIDQIARAGVTFKYTETGPVGLLEGKRAIVAIASGGTPIGSEIDFASGYLRHVLGFIGITDVEFVIADKTMVDADAAVQKAEAAVASL